LLRHPRYYYYILASLLYGGAVGQISTVFSVFGGPKSKIDWQAIWNKKPVAPKQESRLAAFLFALPRSVRNACFLWRARLDPA
jgi:hypothetical protein